MVTPLVVGAVQPVSVSGFPAASSMVVPEANVIVLVTLNVVGAELSVEAT